MLCSMLPLQMACRTPFHWRSVHPFLFVLLISSPSLLLYVFPIFGVCWRTSGHEIWPGNQTWFWQLLRLFSNLCRIAWYLRWGNNEPNINLWCSSMDQRPVYFLFYWFGLLESTIGILYLWVNLFDKFIEKLHSFLTSINSSVFYNSIISYITFIRSFYSLTVL